LPVGAYITVSSPLRGTSATVLLVCLTVATIAGCESQALTRTKPSETPALHAKALASGDFRVTVQSWASPGGPIVDKSSEAEFTDFFLASCGVPFHLRQLIILGPRSGEELLGLLAKAETETPIPYHGDTLDFSWKYTQPERLKPATLADLADYGLRMIYGTDVGFRSYLPPEARRNAIRMWRVVMRERPQGCPQISGGTLSPEEVEEFKEQFRRIREDRDPMDRTEPLWR